MAFPAQVEALMQKGWLWQGQVAPPQQTKQQFISSGWPELDEQLGGGWLQGSINELQIQQPFVGELALLIPVLQCVQAATLWLNPPQQPYAPGLSYQQVDLAQQVVVQEADPKLALWAAEQALLSDSVQLLLMWHPHLSAVHVRRLQQAVHAQQKLAFVITPWQSSEEARAYVNRLQLSRTEQLQVRLLKRRFGWPLPPFPCSVDKLLPRRRRIV